jgi:hypothetical protein
LQNDVYSVRLRLSYLLPEFLPIRGKRARIYYHGIPPFCVLCYAQGHVRQECQNNPVSWNDYIEGLKDTGIPSALFEPIDTSSFSTPNTSNLSNPPSSSTPRGSEAITRAELRSLLQEFALSNSPFFANASQSQNQPAQPPSQPPVVVINPTPRITRSARAARNSAPEIITIDEDIPSRGRGRGRGSVNPNLIQVNPNQNQSNFYRGRGRGSRGRGQNQNQDQNQNPNQNQNQNQFFSWEPLNNRNRRRGQ